MDIEDSVKKLLWVDYTRRNDPATQYWVEHLKKKIKARGYPYVLCGWTKAPAVVAELYGETIKDMQAHGTLVLCQVTYTGYTDLEPAVTPERAELGPLVDLLGADHVRLRFDPIIVGYTRDEHFQRCLDAAVKFHINTIATKFIILRYKNVAEAMHEFGVDRVATKAEMVDILRGYVARAGKVGVTMSGCAELKAADIIKDVPGLLMHGCADMAWAEALRPDLKGLFKPHRSRTGCNCCYTEDWGLYKNQGGPRCVHQCVYCYAK
jgi:hypothetical protein